MTPIAILNHGLPPKQIIPAFFIIFLTKFDELVKSRNSIEFVIPAKAGIQLFQDVLDPGFRRGDAPRDFLRDHQIYVVFNYFGFFTLYAPSYPNHSRNLLKNQNL
jgi:hypothetical protein